MWYVLGVFKYWLTEYYYYDYIMIPITMNL